MVGSIVAEAMVANDLPVEEASALPEEIELPKV